MPTLARMHGHFKQWPDDGIYLVKQLFDDEAAEAEGNKKYIAK